LPDHAEPALIPGISRRPLFSLARRGEARGARGAHAAVAECDGCASAAGTAGCQSIFDELLARDFSDATYFRVHRLLVDTYSLQHPDRYCASAKSLAAHLTGLCALLERGGDKALGVEALRTWLDGKPRIQRPEAPRFRGRLTVADVRPARDPEAYAAAVERWAQCTWKAYSSLHRLARGWVAEALDRRIPIRSR
jgi:hypothetical protein